MRHAFPEACRSIKLQWLHTSPKLGNRMNSLAEYESHLDSIDLAIQLEGDGITCCFSKPFRIALSDCASDSGLAAQVRLATLKLLDENMHLTYAAQRIIQLARPRRGRYEYAKAFYRNLQLLVIHQARRNEQAPLRFENGVGEYAGVHFVELERPTDPRTGTPGPAVRVTRSVPGYHRFPTWANVTAVALIRTGKHLVLCFDPDASWHPYPGVKYDKVSDPSESRFALRHIMSEAELEQAVTDARAMFAGLGFSYSVLD